MNASRLTAFAFAAMASATSAHALEHQAGQIQLRCPDRTPRMSDIALAANQGHYPATQAERNRMLERARSVCAAGLTVVSLIPPTDMRFTDDGTLVSDTRD
jgi:hypothetical protein